jgi:hypothetical protein
MAVIRRSLQPCLPAFVVAAASGCFNSGGTAIVLRIDSSLGAELQSVEVQIMRDGDTTPSFDQDFSLANGSYTLPGTIAIDARDPNDTRAVLIHVAGVLSSGWNISTDVVSRFETGQTVTVDATLGCDADAGCTPTDASAACGTDADAVDFRADFENQVYAPFERVSNPDCFTTETGNARQGTSAAQLTVAPGDTVGTREACALYWDESGETEGNEYFYAWSVYLPPDWTAPPADMRIVGWNGLSLPAVTLDVGSDGFFAVEENGGYYDPMAGTTERNNMTPTDASAEPGHWHDFVFDVAFHGLDLGGSVIAWHRRDDEVNFRQVVNDTGIFTLQRGDTGGSLRTAFFIGPDRAPEQDTRTILYDRVRRGASFEAVTDDTCAP